MSEATKNVFNEFVCAADIGTPQQEDGPEKWVYRYAKAAERALRYERRLELCLRGIGEIATTVATVGERVRKRDDPETQ